MIGGSILALTDSNVNLSASTEELKVSSDRTRPRRIRPCESLDLGDEDALTKPEELRAEFEPWATLMSSATGLAGWRGSSPQKQEISTSVTPNKLAKIMTEQFDWEENAARKIADAEFTMETASGKCGAKTARQKEW